MATYPDTATQEAMLNAIHPQIDRGSGAGKLVIGTAGMAADLVSIPFQKPSGIVATGVMTMQRVNSGGDNATAAGTAAAAEYRDSDDTVIIGGLTVGLVDSNEDIELPTLSITIGMTIDLQTITLRF